MKRTKGAKVPSPRHGGHAPCLIQAGADFMAEFMRRRFELVSPMKSAPTPPTPRQAADSQPARVDNGLEQRLDRMEAMLERLVRERTIKEWYSTAEVAQLVGKAEFTVREYCRLGRINARKRPCGRGRSQEWIVSHAELQRIRNEGLLPQTTVSTRLR